MRIKAGNQLSDDALVLDFGATSSLVQNDREVAVAFPAGSAAVIDVVRDYNVKADGATDDTPNLLAAIADAEAEPWGAQLVLPPGEIRTSAPLECTADNITVIGGGQGNPKGGLPANKAANPVYGGTVIRPLASFVGDYVLKFWQGGVPQRVLSGIFLRDFSVDGFNLGAGVGGIDFQVFNGGMESVTVARATGDGFVIEGIGSSAFPKDAFDLRLHAIKGDSCGGNGITFAAGGSSDNVLSDSKFVANGNYGINNLSVGLQVIGCHIYAHTGPAAVYTITRANVIVGLRLTDINKHGIVLVDDVSHSGGFVIDGIQARDVGKLADNTYDIVNYTPAGVARGGTIDGLSVLTTQANRARSGVNIASANATNVVVGPVSAGYVAPAAAAFGTAAVIDTGTGTRNFNALA